MPRILLHDDDYTRARDTLLAAADALPTATEVERVRGRLAEAMERGYFTPHEDEDIRRIYARYLHVRSALHQTLATLEPHAPLFRGRKHPDAHKAFALSWLAGCMLMRSAKYTVTEFYDIPLARRLLNQAEPRFGIPPNSLDHIHRSATRPYTVLRFLRAARYAEIHRAELDALRNDPLLAPILSLLDEETSFIDARRRAHAKSYVSYRWGRLRARPAATYRRVMRGMFEASGRAVAEMRNPFHRKRVTRKIRQRVADLLQPGDILVTRHDDALSNLFLPGYWPHAAFIIGHEDQRLALGVQTAPDRATRCNPPICILEAKKDGVRFRTLQETLHVDAFVLLRPNTLTPDTHRTLIERALEHEGKLYDFEFDFTRADRLVCTEVIYRSYDGLAGLRFHLNRRAGRFTLSAEDLIQQALQDDRFHVVLLYGLQGNRFLHGERAKTLLLRSVNP